MPGMRHRPLSRSSPPGTHVLVDNGLPFSELRSVLLDRQRRDALLRQVSDPMIADYFHTEFDAYDKGERMHLLGSTLRRLLLLLYAPRSSASPYPRRRISSSTAQSCRRTAA